MKFIMRLCAASLIGIALAVASVTVSAQLMRIERVPIGKITHFYDKGAVEVTAEIPHGGTSQEKSLAIRVTDSLNEYETGSVTLSSKEVETVVENLQQMLDESARTPDDLVYQLAGQKFMVSINGGSKPAFIVSVDEATAGTTHRPEAENRQILKDFVELLKKGQAVLDTPKASPQSGLPQPPVSEATKQVVANSEAGKTSPAAAAALANVGRTYTPQELAQLVQNGQASRCAVVTTPPGAEVYIDGNKGGVSPIAFVLLKQGDTPRTITIKMAGYKTVEKKFVPDGKTIPIALTLERDSP